MSGPTIRERIEALRPWPEGEPLIRALLVYEETVTRSASPTPNLDAMRQAERAARAAAPPVEPHALHFDPSCEECAYLARPVAIHVPAPDPVAGLREHRPDILVDYDGVVVVCSQQDCPARGFNWWEVHALLAEPVPLDVERLARTGVNVWGWDISRARQYAETFAAEYARLTDPKGATDD